MKAPPTLFRFSTASLLWLMTWIGVWITAWLITEAGFDADSPGWMTRVIVSGTRLWIMLIIPPFAVFGMLVGRMWAGAALGALMALIYLAGLMLITSGT